MQSAWDIALAPEYPDTYSFTCPMGRNHTVVDIQKSRLLTIGEQKMKRRIKDIVNTCRETGDIMTFTDFKICIDGIYYHLRASTGYPDLSRESENHLRIADNLCATISDCFDDERDNLVNWFKGIPCSFCHPATGNEVPIKVRMDYELFTTFLNIVCY